MATEVISAAVAAVAVHYGAFIEIEAMYSVARVTEVAFAVECTVFVDASSVRMARHRTAVG